MSASSPEPDFTTSQFAAILSRLEPHLPISDAFEAELPQRQGTWWTSQQEHMVSWFSHQNSLGDGQFTRQTPVTNARTTYNRLAAPAAILWIIEALGEDPAVVQAAADAARSEASARKRPGILRKHVSWSRIAELATPLAATPQAPKTRGNKG